LPVSGFGHRYRGTSGLLVVEPPLLAIRTCGRKPGLDRIIANEIFIIAVLASAKMSCCVSDLGFSTLIQLLTDLFSQLFIHDAHPAFEGSVDRSVI
jgi:hypothetical protein